MPQDDLFLQIYGAPKPMDLFSQIYGVPQPTPSLIDPLKTTVGSALEFLNRPSRAMAETALALKNDTSVMEGIKRGLGGESSASFEDVLEGTMDPGMARTLMGLGLDIATDPLNLVGGLPFAAVKGLKKLDTVADAAKVIKERPLVSALGKRFVPHFNLPEGYTNSRRLLDSEIAARRSKAFEESLNRFKGVSPDDAERITRSLDKPAIPIGDPRLDALATEQRNVFRAQAKKEIEAKVLDPEKVVDNYVTYLFTGPVGDTTRAALAPKLSAKNPFAKNRDLVSIDQALFLGAEPHIAKIAAVRAATGERAMAVSRFFETAVKNFSLPAEAAPAGFRGVNIAADLPIKEIFKGRVFEPSVADDLEKLMRPGETRDALDNAFRVATGVWKGYATAANPGFHLRNMVSNVFNSWLGGMRMPMAPIRYAEAAAWPAGAKRGIGAFTAEQIDEAMNLFGVSGGGHGAFGEIASQLDELAASTKGAVGRSFQAINPLSRFNFPQVAGRQVGSAVEDLSRRALFLDQLHKGKSLEEAALHVKKYLFDYSELTEFERGIRDYAVPFYTWLRKNLPLQMESLVSQPQKFAHVGKVVGEVEETAEEKGISIPKGHRPDWLQKLDAVQFPLTTSTGEKVLFNPDLPYQDLNLLPSAAVGEGKFAQAGSDIGNSLISMLNPAAKIPLELSLNREAFTGREIVNPDVGPEQMVRAPAYLGVLAEASPAFAQQFGLRKGISRQGEEQWTMPAQAAYLANQIPFLTKLGRVYATTEVEQQGTLPMPGGYRAQPRQLSFLGFGVSPLDDVSLAQGVASKLRKQATKTRNLSRQGAMQLPVPANAMEEQILRLVLGREY